MWIGWMSSNVKNKTCLYVCVRVRMYAGVFVGWVCAHDYLPMYVHACVWEIKNAILISVIICVYILEQG